MRGAWLETNVKILRKPFKFKRAKPAIPASAFKKPNNLTEKKQQLSFRGHSTTTWTEFCHFLTPSLRGQFLYLQRGQKQTFFELCLFWYFANSQILGISLYLVPLPPYIIPFAATTLLGHLACGLEVANFKSGVSSFCFHVSCSPCWDFPVIWIEVNTERQLLCCNEN